MYSDNPDQQWHLLLSVSLGSTKTARNEYNIRRFSKSKKAVQRPCCGSLISSHCLRAPETVQKVGILGKKSFDKIGMCSLCKKLNLAFLLGKLTEHFYLSCLQDSSYHSSSSVAFGVAAHDSFRPVVCVQCISFRKWYWHRFHTFVDSGYCPAIRDVINQRSPDVRHVVLCYDVPWSFTKLAHVLVFSVALNTRPELYSAFSVLTKSPCLCPQQQNNVEKTLCQWSILYFTLTLLLYVFDMSFRDFFSTYIFHLARLNFSF